MYTHTHTHTHARTHARTPARPPARMRMHACTHTHVQVYIHVYIQVHMEIVHGHPDMQKCVYTYKDYIVNLTLSAFGAHTHMYTFANKRLDACVLHVCCMQRHLLLTCLSSACTHLTTIIVVIHVQHCQTSMHLLNQVWYYHCNTVHIYLSCTICQLACMLILLCIVIRTFVVLWYLARVGGDDANVTRLHTMGSRNQAPDNVDHNGSLLRVVKRIVYPIRIG